MTARALPLNESAFLGQVLDLARVCGWRVYHARPARTMRGWRTAVQGPGSRGFPDLVLIRGGVLIFAEVKADRGGMSAEQARWLWGLRDAGQRAYVWRPADWEDIQAILQGGDT